MVLFLKGINFQESDEPLQLCVSSMNYGCYVNCCIAIDKMLNDIYKDYNYFITKNNMDINLVPKGIKKIEMMLTK